MLRGVVLVGSLPLLFALLQVSLPLLALSHESFLMISYSEQ